MKILLGILLVYLASSVFGINILSKGSEVLRMKKNPYKSQELELKLK